MPSRRPRPSPEIAHQFLRALDPEGRAGIPHWFQTYDESGRERDHLAHSLRGALGDLAVELIQLNTAGAGVHVVVNESDGNGKATENIVAPRACFIDFDNVEPAMDDFPLGPSIVVRSAHGPHVYWLLKGGESLPRWAHMQLLLAERHDGDLKTRKLTRLQRLPGFLHTKAEPVFVGIERLTDSPQRYTIDELANAWSFVDRLKEAEEEEHERERRAEERRNSPRPRARSGGLAPLERARRYIDQVAGAPEGDRNDHTSKHVASAGYDFGIDCETWIDEVVVWNDAKNKPPLHYREVLALVRSTYRSLERKSKDPPGWKLNEDSDEWKAKQANNEHGRRDRAEHDEDSWRATLGGKPASSSSPSDYDAERDERRAAEMRLAMDSGIQSLLSQDFLTLPCDATPPSPDGFPLTTRGNAMRVLSDHQPTLRHIFRTSQWYGWDGKRWKKDDEGYVLSLVQKRISGMHEMLKSKQLVVSKHDDDDTKNRKLGLREALWKHINKSERAAAIKEVVELTSWQPTVKATYDQLDAHDDLINTQSGVVNSTSLKQRPHDPDQYHTMVTSAPFNAAAECPTWMSFLDWAMRGDKELVDFLQRAAGYSATGHIREQVFFLCYGIGGNGKSTFLNTVMHVLADYATSCDIELFLMSPSQRMGSANEELLALRGVRLVYAFEPTEGRALQESRIKQITGGERITARPLYGKPVHFSPKFSLWLATNHRPVIRGTDDGIWRRVVLIPWKAKITADEKDESLGDKLIAEAPGIMRWILEGAYKWHREGLRVPEQVRDQTASYRDEMDLLGAFLEQCCKLQEDTTERSSVLYETFKAWCETQGERPWKQKTLKERLRERSIACVKRKGIMTFLGLETLSEARPEPPTPGHGRKDVFD